jgi:hypothetical protein
MQKDEGYVVSEFEYLEQGTADHEQDRRLSGGLMMQSQSEVCLCPFSYLLYHQFFS